MPHIDAGKRIDPPMSLPCATATMPDATAAALPPLDPPGERVEVPRIVGRAVGERLGRDARRELGRVRLADEHEPGRAEARGEPGVVGRDPLQAFQESHAAVERVAGRVAHRVLHEERHPAQRAVGQARIPCFGACALEALMDDGVERGIQRFDARDRRVDELRG